MPLSSAPKACLSAALPKHASQQRSQSMPLSSVPKACLSAALPTHASPQRPPNMSPIGAPTACAAQCPLSLLLKSLASQARP
eukprot:365576-Chlamydomonas_euryale.AAC.6